MDISSQYLPATWRLVNSGFLDGPTNMAQDEAILEAVASGDSPATLRFYSWQPACLSLGYGQSWDVVDQQECTAMGWDVVRRPTGGRAILHVDELTYSVCAPVEEPRVHGGVLESYHRLSRALLTGLREMSLEPAQAEPEYDNWEEAGPVCFDGPSNYEITVGGRKLVGSAQVRKRRVVLQHGTLPLYGDITRIIRALRTGGPNQSESMRAQLVSRATTLEEVLGWRVLYEEAVDFMRRGFSLALNLYLDEATLTTAEIQRAAELRAEKYFHASWTKRL